MIISLTYQNAKKHFFIKGGTLISSKPFLEDILRDHRFLIYGEYSDGVIFNKYGASIESTAIYNLISILETQVGHPLLIKLQQVEIDVEMDLCDRAPPKILVLRSLEVRGGVVFP